ncbi:hypothetical protein HN588_08570 [Candidatus Bathyarchaeota archaeon]|nr:hypothetical protein [Candidatus Bathyarchaeota archaeon]
MSPPLARVEGAWVGYTGVDNNSDYFPALFDDYLSDGNQIEGGFLENEIIEFQHPTLRGYWQPDWA